MNKKKTLSLILVFAVLMTSLLAMAVTSSAAETLPTTEDIVNPGWWPSQPMTVANDTTDGTKITFGAGTAWGVRAVGQKNYALNELEVTLKNLSLPAVDSGIFMNLADAGINPASDPGGTNNCLFLYMHKTATGFDINVIKKQGDVYLGTMNYDAVPSTLVIKFEKNADGSWLVIGNNKSSVVTKADMDIMIPDQGKACFSIGNASADEKSLNVNRIRNISFRTDLKPQATNFLNPWWGAAVVIAADETNGTSITFAAGTAWGPRAIGQDVFSLSDLEVTLNNLSMAGSGIFLNFADATTNPSSDPASSGLYFYVKHTETGHDIEIKRRPEDTTITTLSFTGDIPSVMKIGFIKNLDGSWMVRANDKNAIITAEIMNAVIPNQERVCFSIGSNGIGGTAATMNVTSIKYLDAAAAPTSTPVPTEDPAVTPTEAAPTPTPVINNNVNVPNEGDFTNLFWPASLLQVTALDQERGLQVNFPGNCAWGVRAIGTQNYDLDGLEVDLSEFTLSGANRQFIMMIADSEKNSASDPSGRGLLLVYSLNSETSEPEIQLWARPFYDGDTALATYTLQNDITDHMNLKFEKSGDNWRISVNDEVITLTDAQMKSCIPNPNLIHFAPGFGASDSNGLSFIISRVTNKVVETDVTPTTEATSPAATATTAPGDNGEIPQTGDQGMGWIIAAMLITIAGTTLALRRKYSVQ